MYYLGHIPLAEADTCAALLSFAADIAATDPFSTDALAEAATMISAPDLAIEQARHAVARELRRRALDPDEGLEHHQRRTDIWPILHDAAARTDVSSIKLGHWQLIS